MDVVRLNGFVWPRAVRRAFDVSGLTLHMSFGQCGNVAKGAFDSVDDSVLARINSKTDTSDR